MAITTQAGYIAAKAAASVCPFVLQGIGTGISSFQIFSQWRAGSGVPLVGAIPAAAAVCTNALAGALNQNVSVVGGNSLYIDAYQLAANFSGQQYGGLIEIVDRVIASGGLVCNVTTLQAINTPALPARAPAANCQWYVEAYQGFSTTAETFTFAVTYTDATTGNIVVSLGGTSQAYAGWVYPLIPPAGKIIASVQSCQLAASAGVASNFGVSCYQRVGIAAALQASYVPDKGEALIVPIDPTACLTMLSSVQNPSYPANPIVGTLRLIQG